MISPDLNSLNPINESLGTVANGLRGRTIKEYIEEGRAWAKKKEDEGWRYTVMGWLSPQDIKEAGLIFCNDLEEVWDYEQNKKVLKPRGYDAIPTEVYMVENSKVGQLGSKYVAPSKKFMAWFLKKPVYVDKTDTYIQKEIKAEKPFIPNEWNVDDVIF